MEYQKKKSPMLLIAFIVFMLLFAVLRMAYAVLVYGRYSMWAEVLVEIVLTYVTTAPVLLTVVFSGVGIKPLAITFAVINLLVRVFDIFRSFRFFYGLIDWLMSYADVIIFAAIAVLLLLHAAGVIGNRKALAIVLFAAGIGVTLCSSAALLIRWWGYWASSWFFENFAYGALYWLGTLILYWALGAGLLCFTPKPKQPAYQ